MVDNYKASVKIYDTNVTLKDLDGISTQILKKILNTMRTMYNSYILCLEPILGDSPKAVSYSNYHLNINDKYNKLIEYYSKNYCNKTFLVPLKLKGTNF